MARSRRRREEPRRRRRAPRTSSSSRPGGESGGGRRGILSRLKEAPKLAVSLGAIVTLIAGILGLVAWFYPEAKPKPPAPTDAKLEILDFQRHVTLRRYLLMIRQDPGRYSPEQLRRDGVVATVKAVGVSGVKRADLYWSIRDSASGNDLADPHYVHQLAGRFKIRTTGDSGGRPFWAPAPPQPGTYLVRYQLEAPNATILASTGTDTFVVG
jgi:hypothetical protein